MKTLEEYDIRFGIALKSVSNKEIERLSELLWNMKEKRKNIIIMGNGGSLTTASHFAEDLNKGIVANRYNLSEKRFRVIPLSDISALTAYSNDLEYNQAMAQQAINYLSPGDLEIVISASGNSKNMVEAVETAKSIGAYTFGILGFDGGVLKNMTDDSIVVKSAKGEYRIVEDVHLQICHKVIECLEERIKEFK